MPQPSSQHHNNELKFFIIQRSWKIYQFTAVHNNRTKLRIASVCHVFTTLLKVEMRFWTFRILRNSPLNPCSVI